ICEPRRLDRRRWRAAAVDRSGRRPGRPGQRPRRAAAARRLGRRRLRGPREHRRGVARPDERGGPVRRLLALATVVAMVGISAVTLQSLVVAALWLGRTLVCGGGATLVTGLLAITAVYFPDDALLGVLPTQSTIRSVVELVPPTLEQMRTSYPPIGTGDGVALLVTAGVLLVLVLAEMLAIGAWAPAWSG